MTQLPLFEVTEKALVLVFIKKVASGQLAANQKVKHMSVDSDVDL